MYCNVRWAGGGWWWIRMAQVSKYIHTGQVIFTQLQINNMRTHVQSSLASFPPCFSSRFWNNTREKCRRGSEREVDCSAALQVLKIKKEARCVYTVGRFGNSRPYKCICKRDSMGTRLTLEITKTFLEIKINITKIFWRAIFLNQISCTWPGFTLFCCRKFALYFALLLTLFKMIIKLRCKKPALNL